MRGGVTFALACLVAGCQQPAKERIRAAAELPLCDPVLPGTPFGYSEADAPIPSHFLRSPAGTVLFSDNTPGHSITNAGAALGRVLFYDVRLSGHRRTSCASCHRQAFGFGDTSRVRSGPHGGHPARRTMALANARFNPAGRFFWDERAATLEAQVLMPIHDTLEMGMAADSLERNLAATTYYPALFAAAFGSPEVTRDRVASALAQFVRSLVSANSRLDAAFATGGAPNYSVLTEPEREGLRLFTTVGCANCHRTIAHFADKANNIGLDSIPADTGAREGRFKPPSLRNVAVRPPYMHDGRFATLRRVVEFYSREVRGSPFLDSRLRGSDGKPRRLDLTPQQVDALVAFLESLTDSAFLVAAKFSDPFPCRAELRPL